MAQDRPDFGPFDEIVERLIGNLGTALGDMGRGEGGSPFGGLGDLGFGDLGGERRTSEAGPQTPPAGAPRARTPRLDRFARDLTAAAAAGELDPVIGREAEIDQVLEVLARRTKNNPVLVGDPGVGKTAIVEGIAHRVADGDVPPALQGVRVLALDLAGMVAGTRYRGDFEQRLTRVIDEIVAARRQVVVFVDELHAVVGAGSAEGQAMDAGTLLKPALARGDLQLVGATTAGEYRRHIERDPALERRLAPVRVAEPDVAATVAILRGLRERYEAHHDVAIDDAALVAAAELSDRHITDRFLPDKAIDLVDRAGARARIRASRGRPAGAVEELRRAREVAVDAEDYERALQLTREIDAAEAGGGTIRGGRVTVTADDVARLLAETTGIPVARLTADDRRSLLGLEDTLRRRIVGQDEAVGIVADAVRAGRAGLAHPGRPVGSFLFLGTTGVGKTELARTLAGALFGGEDALLRFDMSEYTDRASAYRLVGAPPGHAGFDEPGQLTEAVRRTPYAVVLIDEVEKAHPDVVSTLLQVLDAGRLTDSHGRTVDFTRTVVVLTSNLGAPPLLAAAGPATRDTLLAAARAHFRPEFLNRVDDVVAFRALDDSDLRRITTLLLAETTARLAAQHITLDVSSAAVDWLARRGHEPGLGARPLRRTVGRELERRLSRLLIAQDLGGGARVLVDVTGPDATALTLTAT